VWAPRRTRRTPATKSNSPPPYAESSAPGAHTAATYAESSALGARLYAENSALGVVHIGGAFTA
jgi:hypothetical protein